MSVINPVWLSHIILKKIIENFSPPWYNKSRHKSGIEISFLIRCHFIQNSFSSEFEAYINVCNLLVLWNERNHMFMYLFVNRWREYLLSGGQKRYWCWTDRIMLIRSGRWLDPPCRLATNRTETQTLVSFNLYLFLI